MWKLLQVLIQSEFLYLALDLAAIRFYNQIHCVELRCVFHTQNIVLLLNQRGVVEGKFGLLFFRVKKIKEMFMV